MNKSREKIFKVKPQDKQWTHYQDQQDSEENDLAYSFKREETGGRIEDGSTCNINIGPGAYKDNYRQTWVSIRDESLDDEDKFIYFT